MQLGLVLGHCLLGLAQLLFLLEQRFGGAARLIGIRPAEICQYAIADEAGHIALLAGDRGSDTRLVSREDFPQILRIESAGKRNWI